LCIAFGAWRCCLSQQVNAALSIPVIANGGVECAANALHLLASSGCAAVMSSEALLENPALFAPAAIAAAIAAAGQAGGYPDRRHTLLDEATPSGALSSAVAAQSVAAHQLAFAREYLELTMCLPPAMDASHKHQYGSTLKAHLFKLLHQLFSAHPDLRDHLVRANSPADVRRANVGVCVLLLLLIFWRVGKSRAMR
jgi:tRNA-dihydrouridine synthase